MSERARRIAGGLYGLLLALVYSLTASTIDWFLLRDVPLRLDWPRVLSSMLVTSLAGLGIGALTAWPASFVKGVIYGALGVAGWGAVRALVTSGGSFQLSVALLVTFLPAAVFSAPISFTLRSMIHWHEEGVTLGPTEVLPRYWIPVGAIAVGLAFGSVSQMPPEAKAAVRQTDVIVKNALKAKTPTDMPSALGRIRNFHAKASASYRLDERPAPFSAQRLIEVRAIFDN
ncbi:MAG: hypothetical protein HY260_01155, partial [Chloroflexi bacterium]|nr:hypothetical protein [Chloroflexota bacterium]